MEEGYNIFISWSGERSGAVAASLYEWLPMVVQSAKPWMSKEDIEKGSRGLVEVGKALQGISVGIICLTPENLEKAWILFEAGALSKTLDDKTRVCPYLFGNIRPEDVRPPLGIFQATMADEVDTRKLVGTVSRSLGGLLTEERLGTLFGRMWPDLEARLKRVPAAAPVEPPRRTVDDMMAEVLALSREGAKAREVDDLGEDMLELTSGLTGLLDGLVSVGGSPQLARLAWAARQASMKISSILARRRRQRLKEPEKVSGEPEATDEQGKQEN